MIQILAISGSLRIESSNTAVLLAAKSLVPESIKLEVYTGLGELPHFNPDLDVDPIPESVKYLRSQIQLSDGILISSPEYAHGVPGVLKNALDWLVGSGEFMDKPVALINTSPRASYAQASLIEILTTMAAIVLEESSITIALLGRGLDHKGILSDPEISKTLHSGLKSFVQTLRGNH